MCVWRIFLIAAFITHQSFLYRVPVDFGPVEILPWSFHITKPGRAQRRQGHLSVLAIQVDHLWLYFALFEYFCLHFATDKMTRKSILTCLCALLSQGCFDWVLIFLSLTLLLGSDARERWHKVLFWDLFTDQDIIYDHIELLFWNHYAERIGVFLSSDDCSKLSLINYDYIAASILALSKTERII